MCDGRIEGEEVVWGVNQKRNDDKISTENICITKWGDTILVRVCVCVLRKTRFSNFPLALVHSLHFPVTCRFSVSFILPTLFFLPIDPSPLHVSSSKEDTSTRALDSFIQYLL
jgi:hypothetical protein